MLVVLKPGATAAQIDAVCRRAREMGHTPQVVAGATRTAIAITGNASAISQSAFSQLAGVAECLPVTKPYTLVGRETKPEPTVIDVRGAKIGDGSLALIAGPCSVESREQAMACAEAAAAGGARFFRAGAFKTRTSPYACQGLREDGLRLLDEVKRRFDLRIVTEAADLSHLAAVAEVADVVQIGARNMQHTALLEAAGRLSKPVLIKRAMSATIAETFLAAEYVMNAGQKQVILCERGIRTFERMTRNTLDLSAVVVMKQHSHLPVVADPSHGVGIAWAVPALARAAVVVGADAVMIEIHPRPEHALSDGQQALPLDVWRDLSRDLAELAAWRAARAPACGR
jgi:3-deoxy-7-phosphoheptulonate synthase